MDAKTRKAVLEEYFGENGNHTRFIRVHMDSCDFSLEEYAAVEDPIADPELTTFSIKRDRKYIIPMIANEDGTYRKNLTFDFIGHFSKYIFPGAKRIGFSRCDAEIEMTAAKNVDGSLVVVILNKMRADRQYAIRLKGNVIRMQIPAYTLSTLVIEP